jgi:DNA-binding HxlR family transcriptional regulator
MKREKPAPVCAITAALDVLGGKWKLFLLTSLAQHETLRFSQLQKLIPGVTQKMLTQQLRELEGSGLVARRVYAQVPPRVEYRLTAHGRTLHPVLAALREWGQLHRQELGLAPPVPNCQLVEALAEAAG